MASTPYDLLSLLYAQDDPRPKRPRRLDPKARGASRERAIALDPLVVEGERQPVRPILAGGERPVLGGTEIEDALDQGRNELQPEAEVQEPEPGRWGKLGRTVGRGLAESGHASLSGGAAVGRALDRIPGAESFPITSGLVQGSRREDASPEALNAEREGIRYEYGDPRTTGEMAGYIASRMAGDLAQFAMPGTAAGRLGMAGAAGGGLRGMATRAALNTAAASPVTVAQAGDPESSSTAFLAEAFDSPALRGLASTVPGRVAGDVATDLLASGALEGAVSGVRAGRQAMRGRRTARIADRVVGRGTPVVEAPVPSVEQFRASVEEAGPGIMPRPRRDIPEGTAFRQRSMDVAEPPYGVRVASTRASGGATHDVTATLADGTPVGALKYSIGDGGALHVWGVEVAPEMRRQGIATQMYDQMLAENPGASLADNELMSESGRAFREAYTTRRPLGSPEAPQSALGTETAPTPSPSPLGPVGTAGDAVRPSLVGRLTRPVRNEIGSTSPDDVRPLMRREDVPRAFGGGVPRDLRKTPSLQRAWIYGMEAGQEGVERGMLATKYPEGTPQWRAAQRGWNSTQPRQPRAKVAPAPELKAIRLRDGTVVTGANHGEAVNSAVDQGLLPRDFENLSDAVWPNHFEEGHVAADGQFVGRTPRGTTAAEPGGYVAEPTTGGRFKVWNPETGHVAEESIGGFDAQRTAQGIARRLSAAQTGAASVRPMTALAGAGGGAAYGAAEDDESPLRGALLGGAAGLVGGAALPDALRSMARHAGNEVGAFGDPRAFYSRLDRAIGEFPQPRGTAQQWAAFLAQRTAKGEREWVGIDAFLADAAERGEPVTREQIRALYDENAIQLQEVVKRNGPREAPRRIEERQRRIEEINAEIETLNAQARPPAELGEQADAVARAHGLTRWDDFLDIPSPEWPPEFRPLYGRLMGDDAQAELARIGELERERGRLADQIEDFRSRSSVSSGAPRHEQWQVPGGDNYREVLVTLPPRPPVTRSRPATVRGADYGYEVFDEAGEPFGVYAAGSEAEALSLARERGPTDFRREGANASDFPDVPQFTSSHWDEPNVLLHLRMNDRTLPNGEKVLFVEEVQSDMMQQTRRAQQTAARYIDERPDEVIAAMKSKGLLRVECT